MLMQNIIEPPLFNAQLIRSLGATTYQGAEIGECFAIANQIEPGNKESWYTQWSAFADKNYLSAESYRKEGMNLDAKMAFLRACTYYRTAYFFLEDEPADSRIEKALQRSIDAFHQALEFFESPVEKVAIPFDNITLPGYLYINRSSNQPKPILIDTGGGDGTKEESFFSTAAEALERGIHCLTFEGPGQGSVLRLNKTPFIPDWERVIEKIIDFIVQRPEIDQNKIILIGRSFGGYLAARAAAKEKRIAACIVDPGILDSSSSLESKCKLLISTQCPELESAPLDQIIEHLMETDENLRFMLASRKWRFGAKTIGEMLQLTRAYTVEGLVEKIQCPTLVCDNTLEYITPGQAKKFYQQLQCKKHYVLFNAEEGTGGHCEPLAPRLFSAKMYSWLAANQLL
ncbi:MULTISPECIES: S9 family peptidase [unclassified Legionella]|uniref:alpha/beta hydrolase family protein n=1 Tax=unclassified Legionella TaxID=2622702 RepID=UPI001F5FED41|nr:MULTISPECIES: alpha/beta fold hydrolase [unclassified Legionella]MDI9818312.1 alpha/beta fold hydrolase [Legionella sp. PL877]